MIVLNVGLVRKVNIEGMFTMTLKFLCSQVQISECGMWSMMIWDEKVNRSNKCTHMMVKPRNELCPTSGGGLQRSETDNQTEKRLARS